MARGRRGNGEGTTYQYRDGWAGQISYRDPATGKEKRLTRYAKTEREVIKKLNLLKGQIALGRQADPKSITVVELVEQYLEHDAKNTRPKTIKLYNSVYRCHIAPHFPKMKLSQLSVLHVENWIKHLSETPLETTGEPLSSQMIKHTWGVLKRSIDRAMRHEWIHRNVAQLARCPQVVNAPPPNVSHADVIKIIEAMQDHRFEAAWLIMLGCGLRIGEVLGLTWADIDMGKGQLSVRRQLGRVNGGSTGAFSLVPPKTPAAVRTVPIPPFVLTVLAQHRKVMLEALQVCNQRGQKWGNEWNLVFTTWTGTPLADNNVRREMKKCLTKAGIELNITPHTLRHIHTTLLVMEQVPVKQISAQIGHTSATFTLDRYAHLMPDVATGTASAIQNSLKPTKPLQ